MKIIKSVSLLIAFCFLTQVVLGQDGPDEALVRPVCTPDPEPEPVPEEKEEEKIDW